VQLLQIAQSMKYCTNFTDGFMIVGVVIEYKKSDFESYICEQIQSKLRFGDATKEHQLDFVFFREPNSRFCSKFFVCSNPAEKAVSSTEDQKSRGK
jgi:hypothetical protein